MYLLLNIPAVFFLPYVVLTPQNISSISLCQIDVVNSGQKLNWLLPPGQQYHNINIT
jgi:hypothetical protein